MKLAPDLAYDTPNPGAAGAEIPLRHVAVFGADLPLELGEARRAGAQDGEVDVALEQGRMLLRNGQLAQVELHPGKGAPEIPQD